AYQPLPL
ncbi:hypothetical protein D038_2984B, partial [Vibrio parahaemolyticus IDH02189]